MRQSSIINRQASIVLFFCLFVFLLIANTVYASDDVRFEHTYSIGNIRVKEPQARTQDIISGQAGAGMGNIACGDIGNITAALGLQLNEQSIKDLVSNWKSKALPLGMYFLGTSVPVVKEVIVGARALTQKAAQLSMASCESMMQSIDRMNLQDSKLVQACLDRRVTKGSSDAEIRAAKDFCMRNPQTLSVVDVFGGDESKIAQYLSFLDPQSFARCAMFNQGIKDIDNMTSEELGNMSFNDRMMNLGVLLLPSVSLSAQDGSFRVNSLKIDGKTLSILQYWEKVRQDMARDVERLISIMRTADNPAIITSAVESFGNKYNLDMSGVSLLLELFAIWKERIEQRKGDMHRPGFDRFNECVAKFDSARQYLMGVVEKQALRALRLGLLQKFAELELIAGKSAATASGYRCQLRDRQGNVIKADDAKQVTEKTVNSIRNTKEIVIQKIDTRLDMLGGVDFCREIANSIRGCLGTDAVGTIVDEKGNMVHTYRIADNCMVTKSTQRGDFGLPGIAEASAEITQDITGRDKAIQQPVRGFAGFRHTEFRLMAMVLMMGALLYLGKTIVVGVSKEQWSIVAINSVVILVIISVMYSLL